MQNVQLIRVASRRGEQAMQYLGPLKSPLLGFYSRAWHSWSAESGTSIEIAISVVFDCRKRTSHTPVLIVVFISKCSFLDFFLYQLNQRSGRSERVEVVVWPRLPIGQSCILLCNFWWASHLSTCLMSERERMPMGRPCLFRCSISWVNLHPPIVKGRWMPMVKWNVCCYCCCCCCC